MEHDDLISLRLKRETWTSKFRAHPRFEKTFLGFDTSLTHNDPSKIPFKHVLHMHDHTNLVCDYFHQWLVLMHILRSVFGVHHPWMTMDNLFITKTKHRHDVHVFVLSDDTQLSMHCPHGYHIYLSGFEEAWFADRTTPFRCANVLGKQSWNPIMNVVESLTPSLLRPSGMSARTRKRWKRFCGHVRPFATDIPLASSHSAILRCILPLVNTPYLQCSRFVPTLHDPHQYEPSVIHTQLERMFGIFHQEYQKLSSMFLRQENLERMLRHWTEHLIAFKQDFLKDPEPTLAILRKVLYQYMIDHKYTHISVKSFDLSRMIVALYTWSQWYERYLQLASVQVFDPHMLQEETVRMMACMELFFCHDPLPVPSSDQSQPHSTITVHFHHLSPIAYEEHGNAYARTSTTWTEMVEKFADIHPMLRTPYIYQHMHPHLSSTSS